MRSLALVCLLIPSISQAATWSDFGSAFPVFPCADGWAACVSADGERITPDLFESDGKPQPSTQRISWVDLGATSNFDPFGSLSPYEPLAFDEPEPEPATEPAIVAQLDDELEPEVPREGDKRIEHEAPPEVEANPVAPPKQVAEVDKGEPENKEPPATDGSEPESEDLPKKAALVRPPVVDSGPVNIDCSELVRLEPMAMMGKLSDDHVACLHSSLAAAPTQTEKRNISIVLIKDRKGRQMTQEWEKQMEFHLTEIDQSDPDIAYTFAYHLSRKGPTRAQEAIKWADVAFENRTRWTGKTFIDRVTALHKVRTRSAHALWGQAEKELAAGDDSASARIDKWRGITKNHAREWFEYAEEAGTDKTIALQICMSAGGEDFCTGG